MTNSTIPAPNYTQIPNEVLDRIHEMTLAEWKVVGAVCRLTFGWHKAEDTITLSRLETLTGLSRTSVMDGIVAAMDHGVLSRRQVGPQAYSYFLPIVETGSPTLPVTQSNREPYTTGLPVTQSNQEPYTTGTGSPTLPEPVALGYTQKKGKKVKENDDDDDEELIRRYDDEKDDDGRSDDGRSDDFDPMDALAAIGLDDQLATMAESAYAANNRPLDAAEVALIADYIADPPLNVKSPKGMLASQWRLNMLVPLGKPTPRPKGPAWDPDTKRREPQSSTLTPDQRLAQQQFLAEQEAYVPGEVGDYYKNELKRIMDHRRLKTMDSRPAKTIDRPPFWHEP